MRISDWSSDVCSSDLFEPLDLLVERTGNPDIDAAIVLQPTQAVEQGPRAARRPEISLPTPLKTTGVDPGNLLHGFYFTTFEVQRADRKRERHRRMEVLTDRINQSVAVGRRDWSDHSCRERGID